MQLAPTRRIDIVALMRGWSCWRGGTPEQSAVGYSHITTIGRCVADMPSTRCTLCIGKGRVPGWRVGSGLEFIACPRCSGSGKVDLEHAGEKQIERCCSRCKGKGETNGATCFRCRGSGKTVEVRAQINPAFIGATDAGADDDFDPRYLIVDRAVCWFKREQRNMYAVVAHTYMRARAPGWLTEYQQQHYLALAHDEIVMVVDAS